MVLAGVRPAPTAPSRIAEFHRRRGLAVGLGLAARGFAAPQLARRGIAHQPEPGDTPEQDGRGEGEELAQGGEIGDQGAVAAPAERLERDQPAIAELLAEELLLRDERMALRVGRRGAGQRTVRRLREGAGRGQGPGVELRDGGDIARRRVMDGEQGGERDARRIAAVTLERVQGEPSPSDTIARRKTGGLQIRALPEAAS